MSDTGCSFVRLKIKDCNELSFWNAQVDARFKYRPRTDLIKMHMKIYSFICQSLYLSIFFLPWSMLKIKKTTYSWSFLIQNAARLNFTWKCISCTTFAMNWFHMNFTLYSSIFDEFNVYSLAKCFRSTALHAGADQISLTWEDVKISMWNSYEAQCSFNCKEA